MALEFTCQETTATSALSDQVLGRFVKRLAQLGVDMHSFCVVQNGEVLTEQYYRPFHQDSQHRMYSVGKSFTALAIGALEAEGKLALTDPVHRYLPEACPKDMHSNTKAMTFEDLLSMRTAHDGTTFRYYDGDWVESFFHVPPDHVPGTLFCYDTSATHTLSAIVEKLAKKDMMDYLREDVLPELELSEEAKFLKDRVHGKVSKGGSGMICTLRDMTKVAFLVLREGNWKGKQLLPKEFIKKATTKQVATDFILKPEEQHGYGWQIWKTRKDGFAFYGLGGQLALGIPAEDILFSCTAGAVSGPTGVHDIHQAFWDVLYPALGEPFTEESAFAAAPLSVSHIAGESVSPFLKTVDNTRYTMEENKMELAAFTLSFQEAGGTLTVETKQGTEILPFSLGEIYIGEENGLVYTSSGGWIAEDTFYFRKEIQTLDYSDYRFIAAFTGDQVSVTIRAYGGLFQKVKQGFGGGAITMP